MKLVFIGVFILCGCSSVVYTQACPKDDVKCQTNQDAELLHTLEQKEAAVMLLCRLPQYQSVLACPVQD